MMSKKSPGLDKISTKFLKDADDTISKSLRKIFNLSLQTEIFPDDWKLTMVSPIFKEDSKTECGNYRLISVISTVAKVKAQTSDHFSSFCILMTYPTA